jgi:stalled ribosome alternative rescue factor ArfA
MQRKMYESSLARGERVNGITTILDFDGLGFQHLSCLSVLKECLDFDSKYYPEYLGKLYVINAPGGMATAALFSAVKVFLDPVTKDRIEITAGDPKDFLPKVIPAENLPVEYGGSCTGVKCQHGGMGDVLGLQGCADVLREFQDVKYDFEKIVSASATDGSNEIFQWSFEVADDYDIDFSVELLPASGIKEPDENKKHLIQKVERLKSGKGSYKAPFANAKILLRWDNNFSWMASKQIKYTVSCINENSDSLAASSSSSKEEQKQG